MNGEDFVCPYPLLGGPLDGRVLTLPYSIRPPDHLAVETDSGELAGDYYPVIDHLDPENPHVAYQWVPPVQL